MNNPTRKLFRGKLGMLENRGRTAARSQRPGSVPGVRVNQTTMGTFLEPVQRFARNQVQMFYVAYEADDFLVCFPSINAVPGNNDLNTARFPESNEPVLVAKPWGLRHSDLYASDHPDIGSWLYDPTEPLPGWLSSAAAFRMVRNYRRRLRKLAAAHTLRAEPGAGAAINLRFMQDVDRVAVDETVWPPYDWISWPPTDDQPVHYRINDFYSFPEILAVNVATAHPPQEWTYGWDGEWFNVTGIDSLTLDNTNNHPFSSPATFPLAAFQGETTGDAVAPGGPGNERWAPALWMDLNIEGRRWTNIHQTDWWFQQIHVRNSDNNAVFSLPLDTPDYSFGQ